MKKTIMIDLDGVLDNYENYTDKIPSIKKGAKEFVKTLSKDYELILFTTRSPKLSVEWLKDNKIDKYFKDVTNIIKVRKNIINKIQLICFDSEGNSNLSENLDVFINIAIEYNGKEYLFQNKMWYQLTDNYINNLNKVFRFIKNSFSEEKVNFKKWKNETEEEYINLYKDLDDFYKIHPKLEDGIEICDLMYIDKETEEIKMMFLKDGFGASTRDLSIQVVMGVKRLLSIIKDEDKLKKFYDKYIKAKNSQYSFKEFKKEIKSYSKNAVMIYKLPKSNKETSNIGKQSVIFAKNEIEMLGTCKFTIKQL